MSNQDEILVFGENVKKLRKKENLSKKEMAEIMGVGVRSVTMLENGVLPLRLDVKALQRLSFRFGIKIEDLFSEIPEND